MKITYLLPVVSHARYHKRVTAMQTFGAEPQILAFERDYYQGKPWPNGYQSLGFIQHGHYLRRLGQLLKAIPTVRTAIRDSQAVYCFGIDTLLIAWLASRQHPKRTKLIYEVGDIRELFLMNSLTGRALRWFERFLLKRVKLLVVTSQAFIDGYYHGIQGLYNLNYQVIENKLSYQDLPRDPIRAKSAFEEPNATIRIGYFGLIRYRQSWKVLKELVNQGQGRIRVSIRGILMGLEDLAEEIRQTEYVDFGGPYVSPDDLPTMYSQVDLAWVAHYPGTANIQWARGNNFYEACRFQCPMIAQEGTQDGLVVAQNHIGTNIDLRDVQAATQDVLKITANDIRFWRQNLVALPHSVYLYTDEHEWLMSYLRGDD